MKYFHLTIIRHGETDENRNKIIQGHMETDLSDIGMLQAKETGDFFRNRPIDVIYCSDLRRTCQTADEIALRNEHMAKSELDPSNSIIKMSSLRERSFGVFTGSTVSQWRNQLKSKECSSKSWVPQDGESINQLRDRAILAFSQLCQVMLNRTTKLTCHPCPLLTEADGDCRILADYSEGPLGRYLGHLLLVSHGGFINQLISHLLPINVTPISADGRINIPNCSITQLSVLFSSSCCTNTSPVATRVVFHSINYIGHLTHSSSHQNM